MSQPDYKIYPSLLDKFQQYLDSDTEAESFWNIDYESGEMKKTADEIAAQNEQELLDTINRVPSEPIPAADRGTCFNEIVDCLISGKNTEREDISICSMWIDPMGRISLEQEEGSVKFIQATMNGAEYNFDIATCKAAVEHFGRDAVIQHFCRGLLPTQMGLVELYGYADYIVKDVVHDLKTTSSYSFGKYEQGWQKFVYPYCLVSSGEMKSVSAFEYTAFQLTRASLRNPITSGTMYREVYTYDHNYAIDRLTHMTEVFIDWLECHRKDITDKKIFAYK